MPTETTQIQFQERDLAILRSLFESRLMTLAHVASLHFESRQEATKKRLQKLKCAGLIRERPRRRYEPAVLFLTQKGFKTLSERAPLDGYPPLTATSFEKRAQVSQLTLRHELDVMSVKVAVALGVRQTHGFELTEFSTWPALYQFDAQRPACGGFGKRLVTVKPDGFIRIREINSVGETFEHTFFLEVDRSTETQDTLALRAACYIDYYRSGGLAVRCGATRTDFKNFPFRMLFVFRNAERRNNTAERLLQNQPPIFTQAWLTTFDELIADPLGSIWVRPLDYQTVTEATPFDPHRTRSDLLYRRQPEREHLVEKGIEKRRLIEVEKPADQFLAIIPTEVPSGSRTV